MMGAKLLFHHRLDVFVLFALAMVHLRDHYPYLGPIPLKTAAVSPSRSRIELQVGCTTCTVDISLPVVFTRIYAGQH